jgi:hypothetical protein
VSVSEIARSVAELGVSGPTPRETLQDICVARFAARCHPVRGFEGGEAVTRQLGRADMLLPTRRQRLCALDRNSFGNRIRPLSARAAWPSSRGSACAGPSPRMEQSRSWWGCWHQRRTGVSIAVDFSTYIVVVAGRLLSGRPHFESRPRFNCETEALAQPGADFDFNPPRVGGGIFKPADLG